MNVLIFLSLVLFQIIMITMVNGADPPPCSTVCTNNGNCKCSKENANGDSTMQCPDCLVLMSSTSSAPSKAPTRAPSAAPSIYTYAGQISTIAGSYGGYTGYAINNGPATSAKFNNIQAIVTDISGNVYICDEWNQIVRMVIQSSGIIVTVAGTQGSSGTIGDNGLATSAKLNAPSGITIDHLGNLYISDYYNYAIRKVTFGSTGPVIAGVGTGTISTVVGALGSYGTTMGAATSTRYHFYQIISTNSNPYAYPISRTNCTPSQLLSFLFLTVIQILYYHW